MEEARGRLRSLQEDFLYNLQVLEERDRELERYDAAFARARGLEEAWQAEVSQLKVEVARLRQALAREAEQREDLQRRHQRELREHRLALERAHSDKNSELDQQREQYEKLKWKLERRLQELDGELALQRQVGRTGVGIWPLPGAAPPECTRRGKTAVLALCGVRGRDHSWLLGRCVHFCREI